MTDSRILRPAALLLAAALLTAAALTACSSPGAGTGGGSGSQSGSGSGSGDAAGMGLPADFPADVPLADGEVMLATSPTDASWLVSIRTDDESSLDQADQLLEDAGFTELSPDSHTWRSDGYDVIISIASTNAGFVLNYIVKAT